MENGRMVSQPGEDHREGGGSGDGDHREKEIQASGETLCVSVSQTCPLHSFGRSLTQDLRSDTLMGRESPVRKIGKVGRGTLGCEESRR